MTINHNKNERDGYFNIPALSKGTLELISTVHAWLMPEDEHELTWYKPHNAKRIIESKLR